MENENKTKHLTFSNEIKTLSIQSNMKYSVEF